MPALALALAALAAGCGGGGEGEGPAVEDDALRPPPAYATAGGEEVRLGLSTYCWTAGDRGICADGPAPECGVDGVPDIHVEPGAAIAFELGFDPALVGIAGGQTFDPVRTPEWIPPEEGAFALTAQEDRGDAAYVGCVVFDG